MKIISEILTKWQCTLPLPKGRLGHCHFLGGERGFAFCPCNVMSLEDYQVIDTDVHFQSSKALLLLKMKKSDARPYS